jgi:chromosome segregation and condensation protein ScpB
MTPPVNTATSSAIRTAESRGLSTLTDYVSLETLNKLLECSVHTCDQQSLTDPQTEYNVRKVYMHCLSEGSNGAWKQLLTHRVLTKLEKASGGQHLSYSSFAMFKQWVDYESEIHLSKKRDGMRASLTRLRDDWNKAYLKLDEIERQYDLCGGTNPDLETILSAATRVIDQWNQGFLGANRRVIDDTVNSQEGSQNSIIDQASRSSDVPSTACASNEPTIETPESLRTVGQIYMSALDELIERIRTHPTEVDQVARELRCEDKAHSYAWACLHNAWDLLKTNLGQPVVERLTLAEPVGLERYKRFKERFDTLVVSAQLYCQLQQACPVRGPVADLMEHEEAQLEGVGKELDKLRIQCNIADEDEVPEDFDLVQAVPEVEQNFNQMCDHYGRKIGWKVDVWDWRRRELAEQ